MPTIITTLKILHQCHLWAFDLQSCNFALNTSGISPSSIKTLFDLSPFTTGAVSAARAVSSGTGLAPGAEAGSVRDNEAAVKCSAVYISAQAYVDVIHTHEGCLIRLSYAAVYAARLITSGIGPGNAP